MGVFVAAMSAQSTVSVATRRLGLKAMYANNNT